MISLICPLINISIYLWLHLCKVNKDLKSLREFIMIALELPIGLA